VTLAPRSWALTAILAPFYVGFSAFYIVLDVEAGVSLIWWLALAFALLGALPGAGVLLRRRDPAVALVLILFLALACALPWLNLGPRKAFLRAARGVQVAMTRAEVEARLAPFERYLGEGAAPGSADTVVFRHTFGPGDSDAVVVQFAGERVVGSQLLLD
jgi:hypothetical protein